MALKYSRQGGLGIKPEKSENTFNTSFKLASFMLSLSLSVVITSASG
jgi:hypothetical protein